MKKNKVIISWVLCVVLIMGTLPLSVYATIDTEPLGELVEEIVYIPMTDEELNAFSPYVDVEKAKELGHVMRLEEEEALNDLVFLNMDGSKSRYYFSSNIKYIDENGNSILIDSSTDLANIPAVMTMDNNSSIDKTIVYTKINQPQYANAYYYVGNVGVINNVDYGNGYILVRLNDFCENGMYADLEPEQIIDVSFKLFGSSNPKYNLMACPYTGNDWDMENATCSNTSPSFSLNYISYASYSGTAVMFTMNLTEISKAWLKREEGYDSAKGVYITAALTDNSASSTRDYIAVNNNASFSCVVTYSDFTTEVLNGTDLGYKTAEKQKGYHENEPNNMKTTANIAVTKDGTTRPANSVIRGFIEENDEVDWYAVYMESGDRVEIKLYNMNQNADLDMKIYPIGGGVITSDNNTQGKAEYASCSAQSAGWCYVKIYGNVTYDCSYSLNIKRNIKIAGKGYYTSSQSLYVQNPNDSNYMMRLGRDVSDASCNIMFLGFGAMMARSTNSGVKYGFQRLWHPDELYSFDEMSGFIKHFINGYNDNEGHDSIGQLAIMVSSYQVNTREIGNASWSHLDAGKEFADMIDDLNNYLKSLNSNKIEEIVGGFNFEIGFCENGGMDYEQCFDFEKGFFNNTDKPLYVMADITGGGSSSVGYSDYYFDLGWTAVEVYDICFDHDNLRCIPQISVSNRIDRWITLCEWSSQENWDNYTFTDADGNGIIIEAIKIYGIDCTNSFNDKKYPNDNYNSMETAIKEFVTVYYQYDNTMKHYFLYSTWMATDNEAQL